MNSEPERTCCVAVGLQQCNKYDNGPVGLRYGHVMIMADREYTYMPCSPCVCVCVCVRCVHV